VVSQFQQTTNCLEKSEFLSYKKIINQTLVTFWSNSKLSKTIFYKNSKDQQKTIFASSSKERW